VRDPPGATRIVVNGNNSRQVGPVHEHVRDAHDLVRRTPGFWAEFGHP
jgi:hypothetical protein